MKKLIVLLLMLVLCVYALPVLTVESRGIPQSYGAAQPEEDSGEAGAPSADAVQTVADSYDRSTRLTVNIDGTVSELTLHDYLCGVLAAEMPASFPEEALKAQALAARTYTLYKIGLYEAGMAIPESHNGAQMCTDYTHCKAYCDVAAQAASMWGDESEKYLEKIENAVSATDGVIATYQGDPIAAVFHAASTEKTEAAADVWGGDTPYLQSVESPGGEASERYYGEVSISAEEFKKLFLEKYPQADLSSPPEHWFKASNRSEAGGIIDVAVGGVRVPGTALRTMLGLNSTNFTYTPQGDTLIFKSKGYGHGVGMSQYGARELALQGMTYDEIIKWYYTGVDLTIKS